VQHSRRWSIHDGRSRASEHQAFDARQLGLAEPEGKLTGLGYHMFCAHPALAPASMVRISVPGLPLALLSTPASSQTISIASAVERIYEFLRPGATTLITGAGVSVDSGRPSGTVEARVISSC
jgi:hypothetical protein